MQWSLLTQYDNNMALCGPASGHVVQVLGDAIPTAADIGKFPLVLGVIFEALRLYSPAYMVGRCANREVQLVGGYTLPAGTTLLVR